MPNWVANRLTFEGKNANKILKKHIVEGEFDFNTISPMPEALNIEASSKTDCALAHYVKANNIDPKTLPFQIKAIDSLQESKYDTNELGSLGATAYNNLINYGFTNWYDWRIENWGTKWNSNDTYYDSNSVYFETAWDVPRPIIVKLSEMYPELTIKCEYAEEQIGYYTGCVKLKAGEVIDGGDLEDYSPEAYEVAQDLWGEYDDYYPEDDRDAMILFH